MSDYGNINILVQNKIHDSTTQDLTTALRAVDHLKVGRTTSFAIPLSDSGNTEFFQVDVHKARPGCFEWETTVYSYSDLWFMLGISAHRLGFTINDQGFHLRIAEIEDVRPKDCLLRLTTDPKEMMQFLSLDADRFPLGFTSLDYLFAWATSSRFFRRRYFERKAAAETPSNKKTKRPMYLAFRHDWLPRNPDVGLCAEGGDDREAQRAQLTEEALQWFDRRDGWQHMVVRHRRRMLKYNMWSKITRIIPVKGKELGTVTEALRRLLRWRDGALELLVPGDDGADEVPELAEDIVDAVVLPWVLEHWEEAVGRYKEMKPIGL
ncbi:MAG: hypothetical protein Q9210_000557 [Variospora velana]